MSESNHTNGHSNGVNGHGDGAEDPIVVVGSGCAGLAAAYTACKYGSRPVILIESADKLGGHACTVTSNDGESVDMGFMVCNKATYPNMLRVFSEIGQEIENSDMSLCVHDGQRGDFSWSFQDSLVWVRQNIWRPRLWRFFMAHRQFAKKALGVLASSTNCSEHNQSVEDFCIGLDPTFVNEWLVPFVSAVWSVGSGDARKFAIRPLLRFMHNHRFLGSTVVKWFTPKDRSQSYVKKLLAACGSQLESRCSTRATRIDASKHVIHIESKEGKQGVIKYQSLILAGSAPLQAKLDPPAAAWLSGFRVSTSRVCGHSGSDNMPLIKADWSSWNVRSDSVGVKNVAVTYWVGRIQNLKNREMFVTVNPPSTPAGTFYDEYLSHPIMDKDSEEAQAESHKHQGIGSVYYCGAWLRHGFHEDGFHTGVHAAKLALGKLGRQVPLEFPTAENLMPAVPVKGTTNHVRYQPSERKFSYPLHLFKFDTRAPPSGFERSDHYGDESVPLDTQVRQTVLEHLGFWPSGMIECFCNLRDFGVYAFNPITPYYVHDDSGEKVIALVTEVHNTPWGERCIYAMNVDDTAGSSQGSDQYSRLDPEEHVKAMHVSPFHPYPPQERDEPEWIYKFRLRGKELLIVEVYKRGSKQEGGKNELRFSATLNVEGNKTHACRTGSIRTVMQVYRQAFQLGCGFKMYQYKPAATSPLEPKVFSWLFYLLPAYVCYSQNNSLALSWSFVLLALSMAGLRFSSSSLIPLLWVAAIAVVAIMLLLLLHTSSAWALPMVLSLPVTSIVLKEQVLWRNAALCIMCAFLCS